MSPVLPATELVPLPAAGRRFVGIAEVRLGDTDPNGRLRLDATARMLQDVANDDACDAELPGANGWVVRRSLIDVTRPAVLAETLSLTTFCGGIGRSWAERRTSIVGDQGAAVEAVTLWIQVDTSSGRPRPLDRVFHARYGEAAAGRTVSSRLSLPGPPDAMGAVAVGSWQVRAADLDVFGHVNNAVAWTLLEERLADAPDRRGVGEVEYPAPVDRQVVDRLTLTPTAHSEPGMDWLIADGRLLVSSRWTPAS
ncbi:MAG: acyl-[acyl-carrier-protein] thioesterase [Desertimonas sp.]